MHINEALAVGATGVRVASATASADETLPLTADGASAKYCRVAATKACYIRWGKGAQTALNTDMYLHDGQSAIIVTVGADTLAAIRETADGVVIVTPLEWVR